MDKPTKDDKTVISEIRPMVDLTEGQVTSVFRTLVNHYIAGQYFSNRSLHIPFVGDFKIRLDGIDIENNQRIPRISLQVLNIHDSIKESVQVIEDYYSTYDDRKILDLNGYKDLHFRIKRDLKNN